MSVNWTEDQNKVIRLRDRSILVSAAAGSGKTAVLVERLVSMVTDPDDPADIDRLLVVTFTSAAASQMRERVTESINKALQADPQNHHLLRQLSLIHNAQITTIDSFCLNVIRSHFHAIGLEPGFRVGEEGELSLIKEDVCRQLLDDCYADPPRGFTEFADAYAGARNDDRIRKLILDLYTYSQSAPYPDRWLESCKEQYQMDSAEDLDQKEWAAGLCDFLHNSVCELYEQTGMLIRMAGEPDGPDMYVPALESDLELLDGLRSCASYTEWNEALKDISFEKLKAARGFKGDQQKKKMIQDQRKAIKGELDSWASLYFGPAPEETLALLKESGKLVSVLLDLTLEFTRRFSEAKSRRNIVDFSDIEHYALQVLVDPETGEPTEIAAEYQDMYREVLIDEYQDSNYVQEMLLSAVSRKSRGIENYFMVGDVKQSIYRFRLARPELFLEKQDRFSTEDSVTQRIDLDQNFRSRPQVLDCANAVFEKIMLPDLGRIRYDEAARLHQGKTLKRERLTAMIRRSVFCRRTVRQKTSWSWRRLLRPCGSESF